MATATLPIRRDTIGGTYGRMATAAVGLVPAIAGFLFYRRWLDLFPQIEFRTWMWSNADLKWYLVSIFTHQGAFSRSSSFLADNTTRAICGVSIHCINQPGFWTILLVSYLLFWLIIRLTRSLMGATIAATIWVLSLPVLDAFGWQATFGDRLATLFGLATVHVALSMMRWLRHRFGVARALLANVLVLVPAIIAYNSKEISWLLLPSLLLLAVALADGWMPSIIGRHASVLVATGAYVIFRTIDTFVLIGESPSAKSLDFGGDPTHNAKLYAAFLTNHLYFTIVPRALPVLAFAGMVAVVYRYRTGGRDLRGQVRIMAWATLSLLGGVVLCLFTPAPGAYLLLLPSPFLWVALVALWCSLAPSHDMARAVLGFGVATAAVVVMLFGLNGSFGVYGKTLSWSHNFRRSLPTIAKNVPMGAPTDFVIGEAPFLAYRFVGDDGQRVVDPFIYSGAAPLLAVEDRMHNVPTLDQSFTGYSIVLDGDLTVAKILRGTHLIYRAGSPRR
jgi:hypothetical protein